jgi:hypothetical protein
MEPAAAFYLAGMLNNPERDLAFAEASTGPRTSSSAWCSSSTSGMWRATCILAKDDKHRATLLVMRDLQHPGRALDGSGTHRSVGSRQCKHLPLLLAREVNKLEDWLLTPALTEFNAAIRQWNDLEEGVTREEVLRVDLAYLHAGARFHPSHRTPRTRRTAPLAQPAERSPELRGR